MKSAYKFMVAAKITGIYVGRYKTEALALKKIRRDDSGRDPLEIREYSEVYYNEMK